MKAVSIYAMTRNQNTDCLQMLERQLSGRESLLKIREWELQSMKALVHRLEEHMEEVYALRLFYSFQIPRLGKEFDLLQIKEDQIVNIELKSGGVSDEAVRRQLMQNRYYLSVLGRPILSYTYISSQDRLVRLTRHDHLVPADWTSLCEALQRDSSDYQGEIEDLFRAEFYLISPLTDPFRFLNKEYFLTSQQRDIERRILKKIRETHAGYFWFTGLPGTGKTLLLYDIAMGLSVRQQVCIIHCGESGKEWQLLHERLQRIAFLSDHQLQEPAQLEPYRAILVDEAHLLSLEKLEQLVAWSGSRPVIFSTDSEDVISPAELDRSNLKRIEKLPDVQIFHLTNRIRTNEELSSFIQNMLHLPDIRNQRVYPHITVVYANDEREAEFLKMDYILQGYQDPQRKPAEGMKALAVRDTERLVTVLDSRYYYDETGYLRTSFQEEEGMSQVRDLFHLLNQAKENLALVVQENPVVYEKLLNLL